MQQAHHQHGKLIINGGKLNVDLASST